MPRETTEDIVVVRQRIRDLRKKIKDTADKLRSHIGSGGNAHHLATKDAPGFMSKQVYANLLDFQNRINSLKETIDTLTIPENGMVWWWGDPTDLPKGFVFCNGNNGTINFADKYVMGSYNDAELGVVAGQYYNWCYNGNVDAVPGTPSIATQPPFVALNVIKKVAAPSPVSADAVGDLHIFIGSNLPTGILECNGQTVPISAYLGLSRYAQNSGLCISSATYTSYLNTYGTCPYFVYDVNAGTLRIPTIREVLAMRTSGAASMSASSVPGPHYHGIGTNGNNNGCWGYKPYTASYPSGSQASWWNGSNGGVAPSGSPPTSGITITSLEISVGSTGNGLLCNSTNVTVGIRAFHPEYVSEVEASLMTLSAEQPVIDVEAIPVRSADEDSLIDTNGWEILDDGLIYTWGEVQIADVLGSNDNEAVINLPLSMKDSVYNVKVLNTNTNSDEPWNISSNKDTITISLGKTWDLTDTIKYKVMGR